MNTKSFILLTLLCALSGNALSQRNENDQLILNIMHLESILLRKSVCESRFPQYKAQNSEALEKSSLASVTSERIIEAYAKPQAKQGLLEVLALDREKTTKHFETMDSANFEKMCADFPNINALAPKPQ